MKNLILIGVLFLVGCSGNSLGKALDPNNNSNTQSYSYNLTENGCGTDEHVFSSREAMCDGLKNESLNHSCAYNLRRTKFNSDCGDRSW